MRRTKILAAGAAIGLAAAVAGCSSTQHAGGSGGSNASGNTVPALSANLKAGGTVTIANETGATWNCQFNPLTTNQQEANGYLYESLLYINPLQSSATPTPLLATSYAWNSTDTRLTFDIRSGVKWSDGTAFSAQDVAYTFNLIKKYSSLDTYALWAAPSGGGAGLTSATASGDKVTLTFSANASVFFYDVANMLPIVPQHIWSPPVANVSLIPNTTQGPTANLAVRQAISYALNRAQIAAIGEQGEEPAANQTGVVTPTFTAYLNSSALSSSGYSSQNLTQAAAALKNAGYSTSHPLSLTVKTVTGYTDWDADLQVIKQELAGIGINITVLDEADNTFTSDLQNGNFQVIMYGPPAGPTPYYELHLMLDSANDQAIGSAAQGDYGRYKNSAVDAAFGQYAAATSASAQQQALETVESYMLNDVPLIPVVESVDWFQYSTADLQGWPSAADAYAQPSPWTYPDVEQVLLRLYSKTAQ